MRQVSFCCSTSRGTVLDRRVAEVKNLSEARRYAAAFARSVVATAAAQDWAKCRMHVRDERGDELFVMPFWSAASRPALTARLWAVLARAWPWTAAAESKTASAGGRISLLRSGDSQ
jgi:hypothetical protein